MLVVGSEKRGIVELNYKCYLEDRITIQQRDALWIRKLLSKNLLCFIKGLFPSCRVVTKEEQFKFTGLHVFEENKTCMLYTYS